jgi:hypothetical protein
MTEVQDDRIFRSTRVVAVIIVPVLVLAFLILFLFPQTTGQRFAWEINPAMTAVYMGAGYLGGAWLFFNVINGRRWHRVAPGFLPVTTFTIFMIVDTILHWGRFDIRHLPFTLWLVLYIVTPFLVPFLWWRNRRTDPGTPEADDVIVPQLARWTLRLLGFVLLLCAVIGVIYPAWLVSLWVWPLSPLTARILSGWFALLGVGGLVIGQETRWSGWKVGLQSIGLWHVLVVIGAVIHRADFNSGLLNWYLISVLIVLLGMVSLYVRMESERRKTAP